MMGYSWACGNETMAIISMEMAEIQADTLKVDGTEEKEIQVIAISYLDRGLKIITSTMIHLLLLLSLIQL